MLIPALGLQGLSCVAHTDAGSLKPEGNSLQGSSKVASVAVVPFYARQGFAPVHTPDPSSPMKFKLYRILAPGVNRIINYIFFPGVYWRSCKTLLQILDKKIFQYCKNAAVFCGTWSDISFLFLRDLGMPGV